MEKKFFSPKNSFSNSVNLAKIKGVVNEEKTCLSESPTLND